MKLPATLESVFFLLGIVALAILIVLSFKKGVWRRWPFFTGYCIWDLLGSAAAVFLNHYWPLLYIKAYSVLFCGDTVLEICLLIEIAWAALGAAQRSVSRKMFAPLLLFFLLSGGLVWPLAITSIYRGSSKELIALIHLNQTASILQILLFLLLAAGSQFLGISWRGRELQIATGLGIYSFANLSVALLHAQGDFGFNPDHLQLAGQGVGICCLFYWILCFVKSSPTPLAKTDRLNADLRAIASAAQAEREAVQKRSG